MATALVTGGTAGIGHAFAKELGRRGYDLVLVARDTERMNRIAEDFARDFHIRVDVITADLAVREDMLRVRDRLESQSEPIDVFINNAGFAVRDSLLERDFTLQEKAFDVMCLAVLVLAGAAGRSMKERGRGTIINVGSSSGTIMTGNYSAIKAWVNTYSQALSVELRGTGVNVTALLPGWVRTEFHTRAGVTAHTLPDIVWIDIDALVKEALNDAFRGKAVSVPTVKWKIAVTAAKILPLGALRELSARLTSSRSKQKH